MSWQDCTSQYTNNKAWENIVSQCTTTQLYLEILEQLEKDNIFNHGRKLILLKYTDDVCKHNPSISNEILFIFDSFIHKHYKKKVVCIIQ